MKNIILLILLMELTALGQYTEFYINNGGGGNTNSGHTADASPTFAAQDGYWTNYTGYGVFFKAGMTLTAVTNGAWAAVYTNDSTATAFIGIITNVDDAGDFIFVKTVEAKAGTAPTQDDANGKTHITVGGAWFGPKSGTADATSVATNTFPFALFSSTMTNGVSTIPRFNIKGGTTYSITNGLVNANVGPWILQGYTNTIGDLGNATIDGGTVYPGYNLLSLNGNNCEVSDIILGNNGASGASDIVVGSGNGCKILRCVFHDSRRHGLVPSGAGWMVFGSEAYSCNKSGAAGGAGFKDLMAVSCISHDNTGATSDGFTMTSVGMFINCISVNNSRYGFNLGFSTANFNMFGCIAYSNVHTGVLLAGTGALNAQNCIFLKNGSGITNSSATLYKIGNIINCVVGYGANATNTHGSFTNFYGVSESGTISVDALPWVSASTGNYILNSSSILKSAGYAAFTETGNAWTGTISYPDIGAVQSASTNATAAGTSAHTFAQ